MTEQLYIIPYFKKDKLAKTHLKLAKTHLARTHLARVYPFAFGQLHPEIEKLCLPNLPIWLHNCECPEKCTGECDGIAADTEWAEYWDEFFNKVTCETCLRIARYGYKRKINDKQG